MAQSFHPKGSFLMILEAMVFWLSFLSLMIYDSYPATWAKSPPVFWQVEAVSFTKTYGSKQTINIILTSIWGIQHLIKGITEISLTSETQGLPFLLLTKESRVGKTITADVDFLALMLFLEWTCRITQMVLIPVRYQCFATAIRVSSRYTKYLWVSGRVAQEFNVPAMKIS